MLTTLRRTFTQYFSPGDIFIVGVSGGVDSMTLMFCLSQLQEYKFIIVSIDHGIREDSQADTRLVCKEAEKLGFACFIETVKVPTLAKQQRKGIEETARDLRYEIFKKYQKKHRAKAIITAHHQNDQSESILLHLLRGSDIHGLVGMKILNERGIFRPFLEVSKEKIIAFAQKKKLIWHEDSTNTDIDIVRNLIRHHIAPEFPQELLLKISNEAGKMINMLDIWVREWVEKNCTVQKNKLIFPRKSFIQMPLYLQFYLLHYFASNYFKINHLSFSFLSGMYQWLINVKGSSSYKYQQKILFSHKQGRILALARAFPVEFAACNFP